MRTPSNAALCVPPRTGAAVVAAGPADGRRADATVEDLLVGDSAAMVELRALVRCCARSAAPVLVEGETGVGKERVARALHRAGPCASEPFVAVDCGALPEALFETELFGHRRGAFTGADRDHPGLVACAGRGTLFLDEVEDLSASQQGKLLRFLQEREYRPVGATHPRRSPARIVAASNVDLTRLVEAGRFRRDLYFRLDVLRLDVPPLRARRGDLAVLIRHLLARGLRGEVSGSGGPRLEVPASVASAMPCTAHLEALAAHEWPGNVRELENLVARVSVFAGVVGWSAAWQAAVARVAQSRRAAAGSCAALDLGGESPAARPAPEARAEESANLVHVLARHRWRRADAARELGVSRVTLWRRMRRAGLLADRGAGAG